ncbi:MAG: hypothetical protein CNLJKLNK_01174 [Holosporales bacterium]
MVFLLKSILNLSWIYPNKCISCSDVDIDETGMFCPACWKDLIYIQPPFCDCCGLPFPIDLQNEMLCHHCQIELPAFHQARALLVYNDIIKRPILRLKHYDQTQYAKYFAKLLLPNIDPIDYIIPIPLHWTRLFWRQYNQAGLIAHHLGKLMNTPVLHHVLQRCKKTKSQKNQKREQRIENLKAAFSLVHGDILKDKRILIIDDVMTTGSTLNQAALALKKAKPKSIQCWSIARSVPGMHAPNVCL